MKGLTLFKVVKGLNEWLGKVGEVIFRDFETDEVVIRLPGLDDGGEGMFDVRMPADWVKEEKEIAKC